MTPVRQGRRAGESTQQVRERAFEAVITGYTDSDRKWRGKIIRSVTFNAGGGVTFDLEPDEVAIEPRKGVHDDKPLFGPHPTMPNVDVTYFVPAFVPQSDAVSPYTDSVVPVRSYSVIDQDGQTVEVWKCDIGLSFVCAEAAEPGTFGDGDGGGPGDGSDPIATDPGVPVPPGGLGPGGGTVG